MSEYLVGDLVAEFLERCGVTAAFGIVSVHNIPILDAVARRQALRFVMARGEMGASHMADGFARVRGELGALVTSTGPGAANAVSGLVEANFAGTPLLHITGQSALHSIGRGQGSVHDVPDQLGMLRSVSKVAYRIRSPQEALGILTKAAVEALTPPCGPVSVEIPFDIQRTPIPRPASFGDFSLPLPRRRMPTEPEMANLVERVQRARRPLLWLGSGARDAGAAARALLDMGFGMVNSLAAQGIVPADHPLSLGALNGAREPDVESFYASVDLLLVVGARIRFYETREGTAQLPKNLIQIDIDPAANGRTYPSDLFVCGDSAGTLGALADSVAGRMHIDADFGESVRALKARVTQTVTESLGPYAAFPRQLREVMPRDAIWVRDVTLSNGGWGNRIFPVYGPRDGIYPIGLGIGPALPLAIGAAVAAPERKVIVMCGDGGFAVNMTELWTVVQEKLDITILLMNDHGYGVIRHIQDGAYGGRRHFGDLLSPDFAGLAELAGIPFWRVTSASAFRAAAASAVAEPGPSMVEVDMTRIGDFPPYLTFAKR